jgi:hypothetical protein
MPEKGPMNRRAFLASLLAAPLIPKFSLPEKAKGFIPGVWATLTVSDCTRGPRYYMNRTMYQEFLRARICRQAYLDQFKILGIAPPECA